ncbi:MAG: hypothetical protein FJZ16_04265 [Candidatus Omnitrophica bacterium]|nr:hypothetical protein [Candidatus Omnitrophota bacterium]
MKKTFLLGVVFITIYMFMSLAFVYAADEKKEKNSKLTTFFEVGEKITDLFGYEDTDILDDIRYLRHSVSFNQKASPKLSYTISQLLERRNYDKNDLFDNKFTQTTVSATYRLGESECFLMPQELRTSYMFKLKNYVHTISGADNNDYEQNKFSLGVSYIGSNKNWQIDYDTGINSFDYARNSINNENKIFNQIQLRKKILDNKLDIYTGYKIQYAERKNGDDRTEPEKMVGFDFKPGLKYLSLVSFRFENGKTETREEEVREDIRDYKYERFITKVDFPIASRLSNSFVHKYIYRKYDNFNKSYHQLKLNNTTRYTQIDDKVRVLYYELGFEYKEGDFIVSDPSNYKWIAETLSLTYEKKKNLKVTSGFSFRRKEFSSSPISDSKRWVYTLGLEKAISPGLSLAFDLRKEWRDYYQGGADKTYEVYKMSLNYKF